MLQRFYCFVFVLLCSATLHASTETVLASRAGIAPLQPIQSQTTGFSLLASDQQLSYMLANPTSSGTPWTNRFTIPVVPNTTNYAAYSTVTLRYDESRAKLHTAAWDIEITYNLNTYNATNQLTSYNGEVLKIDYDPGAPYTDKVLNRYPNSFRSELRITQVKLNSTVVTGALAAQYADVFLDLEQSTERYYTVTSSAPVTTSQYLNGSNELEVRWDYVEGAESYDVEWVFVDINGDPAPALSSSQVPFDFGNASRVNVPDQYYRIPMAYPRGVLVYRVRAVGTSATAPELYSTGPWSWMNGQVAGTSLSNNAPSGSGSSAYRFDYEGLHKALNWQYSCTFAEDGKRSEQIAFYDGSLRNRQTVGVLNTDQTAIVGEAKYDYTGRAALSMLPVPVPGGGIKWYSNFNPNFDRSQWDADASVETPAALSTTSGAGRYYSTANTSAPGINGQYTPDAQGYAYARMRYLPDGTGRPMSASAPGPDHKTGSGHEVRYFYGSPSSADEVDRLFGNEAGNVTHYQKNLVVDANGQSSVSYLDQQGRVVATALAGDVPQNLLALDTRPAQPITRPNDLLGGSNQIDYNTQAMVSHKEIMVTAPNTPYTFNYSLNSDTTCSNCFVCKSCVYDLEISVRDIYGVPVSNAAIITSNCPQTVSANPLLCTGISSGSFSFSVTLDVGRYTIEKRLSLSEASLEQYADEFKLWQLEQFTCPEVDPVQPASCDFSCASICEQQFSYIDAEGVQQWTDDQGLATDSATAAGFIAACEADCKDVPTLPSECDVKLTLLKMDMSPGGQYFENLPNRFVLDANGNLINNPVYNNNGWLTTIPAYTANPSAFWTSLSTALNTRCSTSVTLSSWTDLRSNWQECFADELVKYHPEYCQWQYFCEDPLCIRDVAGSSIDDTITIGETELTDILLLQQNDENQAVQDNYFNLLNLSLDITVATLTSNTGNTTYQNFADPSGTLPLDAYFVCNPSSAQCSTLAATQQMETYLRNFYAIPNSNPQAYFSIWYVMEDPQGIHLGNQTVDPAVRAFFRQLHGDPTASPATQGILAPLNGTPQPGQITRWTFYRSVYLYYKRLIIYANYHNPARDCNTLLSDNDGDGYTDITTTTPQQKGYQIRYPKNPIYDLYLADPANLICTPNPSVLTNALTTFNTTNFTASCHNACQGAAQGWIDELNATCTLTPQQEIDITNYLILVCQANCGNTTPEGSSGCSTCPATPCDPSIPCASIGVQLAGNPSVVFYDFQDVISYFTSNACSTVVTHPYSEDDATCSCSLLSGVISANFPNQVPTTQQIADLMNQLYPRGAPPITPLVPYTAAEIAAWQAECAQPTPSQADLVALDYPGGLMCYGPEAITFDYSAGSCACGNVSSFINQLGLDKNDPANHPAIAAAVNAFFAPASPVTAANVNAWLTECGQPQPLAANLFAANLPDLLRCPVPADNSEQAINVAMATAACQTQHLQFALANAISQYMAARNEALEDYLSYTRENCLNNLIGRETFTETHSEMEYHYTLYYYDQAGNLVKTVPPDGVKPLTPAQVTQVQTYRSTGTGSPVYPAHTLVTRYKYNSLQQMTEAETPDGGLSYFWYDQLGRVILSQNARQRDYPQTDPLLGGQGYSYVLYDNLGRPTESGELINATTTYTSLYRIGRGLVTSPSLTQWMTAATLKREISTPWYDDNSQTPAAVTASFGAQGQTHLRNRISYIQYDPNPSTSGDEQLSYFSYDIHGSVHTLVNDNRLLSNIQQNLKKTTYKYDLVSGNVNEVWYQRGEHDQLGHRYRYDADNRLRQAFTSTDGVIWTREVKYQYYAHGVLARTELGEKHVQGTDYAYTINGWIKGVNSTTLDAQKDIGRDGATGTQNYNPQNRWFAQDASAFSLGYFTNDYKAVSGLNASTVSFTADETQTANPYKTAMHDLYNGNISRITSSQRDQNGNALEVLGRVFRYDQLNRIKKAEVFTDANLNANNYWSSAAANTSKWKEEFSFDGNGNIQTVKRYNASGVLMDNLSYNYATNKNQLVYVDDAASTAASTDDLEDQNAANYTYDKLGNLVTDASEEIGKITWNTSGKITAITRIPGSNKPDLEFVYDGSGMRIAKIVKPKLNGVLEPESKWVTTWYSKDASGQVLAVYEQKYTAQNATNFTLLYDLKERHLYGGARVGLHNDQQGSVDWTFTATVNAITKEFMNEAGWAGPASPQPSAVVRAARKLGNKVYELSNHLGNVLSTISDRRKGVGSSGVVSYYVPEVVSYNEYYVYGSNLGGTRTYSSPALKYRYGFNGKENEGGDINGADGASYDLGARIYDARIGRFLSTDPLESMYAWQSTYVYFSNCPTSVLDVNGMGGPPPTYDGTEAGEIVTMSDGTRYEWFRDNLGAGHWALYVAYGAEAQRSNADPQWQNFIKSWTPEQWDAYVWDVFQAKLAPYQRKDGHNIGMYGQNDDGSIAIPYGLYIKLWNEAYNEAMPSLKAAWASSKAGGSTWGVTYMYWKALTVSDDDEGYALVTDVAMDVGIAWVTHLTLGGGLSNLKSTTSALVKVELFSTSNLSTVTNHISKFANDAGNEIMLGRMQKINQGTLTPTQIDINFMKHELREIELMKSGMTYENAHAQTLIEQKMMHKGYASRLYTKEALDASENAEKLKYGIKD